MKVIQGTRPDILQSCALTLGMFDGVHLGHQALLRSCRSHAKRLGLPATVLTYEPHPSEILHPEHPVRRLTSLAERLERFSCARMDLVLIAEFTADFSRLSAEQFLRDVLVSSVHPRVVVAGYRTAFGHARGGSADMLRAMGEQMGFAVDIVAPILVEGEPVSSSRIRRCLGEGDVQLAQEQLGYPYSLSGAVERGDGRGHALGFPTANLNVAAEKLIPADGVYAVDVIAPGVFRRGVMNIGARPTFGRPRTLEVHLLDFHAELVGMPLTVIFRARLREIAAFPSVNALLEQIRRDIEQARALPE